MKITFVYPRFEKFLWNNPELERGLVDYFLGDFTTPPSLGIPIMASWTPPEYETELIDDNSGDPVDYDTPRDLVAINCFTPQATRAFEIADGFRARGTKVIMGGFFPSFMPEECLKHADSVNLGEVEPTWERILEDVRAGNLQRIYKGGCRFDLSKMRIPRREIFYNKDNYDWDEDLVQLTRGCSYTCAMCAIPAHMGHRIRFRPIEQVVEEVKTLRYENVYLADDTLFFPQRRINEYARELFKALIPLGKKYFVSSTMALNIDKEFLDLATKAGVRNFYCTMNVDPYSIRALQGEKKERGMLVDLVKMLQDREVRFFGSCALGRDWDDTTIAERILELYQEADIHTAEFFIFTPYPGSVHWDRLDRQGRIIDKTWAHYNGAHVVTKPMNMSPEELYRQFINVWNGFFTMQKKTHAAALEPATYKSGVQVVGKPLQRKQVNGQAVVTGIGVLSPIGNSPDELLSSLKHARHGIAPITRFDTSHFRTNLGAQLSSFDPEEHLSQSEREEYDDLYLQYGISAARRALAHSGLEWNRGVIRRDVALVVGTCNGGLLSAEAEYAWKHGKLTKAFDEKMNTTAQYYGLGKALSRALGIGGEVWLITTACSSTTGALGFAQQLIAQRRYSTVLVGGVDALCLANMAGFDALKATSTGQTAPFSIPVGLNIGEGACFWVIEDLEKALLRHATCYGKIAGAATTCDAYHPTTPDPRGDGVYRTLRDTLAGTGLSIESIGCINAHGTGTEANDKAETKGVTKFIGDQKIPVVSTKSFFGHCMGVTGILEATCNLVAMNDGFIPPTVNYSEPRPGCTLDYVPNEPRRVSYDAFLSANYAFGGNNAGVVVTKWEKELPSPITEPKRVVITGAGVVSSLGVGTNALVQALSENRSGIGPVDRLGLQPLSSCMAGLVPEFNGREIDRRVDFGQLNPISKFAVAACALALADGNYRVGQKNAERVGIAMGVCNGPSEMEHMDSVFSTENYQAHIAGFSNITANSTAGWVANRLMLKGPNTSLAPGHHAGVQAMAYGFEMVRSGKAQAMIAAASDEIYPQTYFNYDLIGYLYQGDAEKDYRLHLDEAKRKVLGEGAGSLLLEPLEEAQSRHAPILAEILSYGMSMDAAAYSEQALGAEGLAHAMEVALKDAGLSAGEIDLVVWAPQGNLQDRKVIDALKTTLGAKGEKIPLLTTTFHTGYIESASILISVAAVLEALDQGKGIWPQRTGLPDIDTRPMPENPRHILVAASSDLGYNFSAVLARGEQGL